MQEQVDAGFLTPEQARYHPYSNVITRCVGASEAVEADILHGELRAGDVVPARLRRPHRHGGRRAPAEAPRVARDARPQIVDSLIAEANRRGGLDNITAIVVQVISVSASTSKRNTDEHPVPSHG